MPETTPISATDMPDGDYAIVEVQGHRTLIGRISEIDRFGTKLLQVEPLFADVMLGPVLVHGSMLYQLTPCSAAVAFQRRPKENYQLPASIFATVPAAALPSNEEGPMFFGDDDVEDDVEEDVPSDGIPF